MIHYNYSNKSLAYIFSSNLSSDTSTELNKYQQTNDLSAKLSRSTPNSTVKLSLNLLKHHNFDYGTRLHITVRPIVLKISASRSVAK